jgi:hypothetical protein
MGNVVSLQIGLLIHTEKTGVAHVSSVSGQNLYDLLSMWRRKE